MNAISDDLLSACIRKDRKAQHELYKLSYSFLVSICLRYTRNREDADALLNLGFLKILNNLEKRRKEIPFPLWIRRIQINTIIDEYRKNKKEKEQTLVTDFSEDYEEYDEPTISSYVQKADAEYILQLIAELPAASQKVFNLFAIDGFSHKEIAGMMGISEGTSKWHLNFARTKLKEKLKEVSQTLTIVSP
jgi:RNA polymerase sigma factor (sigma-70 family)